MLNERLMKRGTFCEKGGRYEPTPLIIARCFSIQFFFTELYEITESVWKMLQNLFLSRNLLITDKLAT